VCGIEDPYVGGNGTYYDQVYASFDLYNNRPPNDKAPFGDVVDPWQPNPGNQNPAAINGPNDAEYFSAWRNGLPGTDILKDIATTQPSISTSDYTVEMWVSIDRLSAVTNAGGTQATQDQNSHIYQENGHITLITNKYPNYSHPLRDLYITYDIGTGVVSGVTADGVTFSGKVGQSIFVSGDFNHVPLSFTVNLDSSVAPVPFDPFKYFADKAIGLQFGTQFQQKHLVSVDLIVEFGSIADAPPGVVTFELIKKAHGHKGKPRVKVLGTAPLVGGRASLWLRPQQVLNKPITVVYSGDADFQPATVTLPILTRRTVQSLARTAARLERVYRIVKLS
jgi:hypothetical protein